MIALLLRLYPARWRTRYGDEFAALLAERPLGPFDVADVLLGALDAHLHLRGLGSWSEHRRGFPMSLRLGGIAAVAGGALWFTGFLWSTLDPADEDPGAILLLLGTIALLVGLAGLSAFQARRHPMLVWAAFALPAVGGALHDVRLDRHGARSATSRRRHLNGWGLFIVGLLATIAGSLVFAIATYRTAALPRSGAVILGISAVISLIAFVGAVEPRRYRAADPPGRLGSFAGRLDRPRPAGDPPGSAGHGHAEPPDRPSLPTRNSRPQPRTRSVPCSRLGA